jgi:hypothetical protein
MHGIPCLAAVVGGFGFVALVGEELGDFFGALTASCEYLKVFAESR